MGFELASIMGCRCAVTDCFQHSLQLYYFKKSSSSTFSLIRCTASADPNKDKEKKVVCLFLFGAYQERNSCCLLACLDPR